MLEAPLFCGAPVLACKNSGYDTNDHFVKVNKMIETGKGETRKTRYNPGFKRVEFEAFRKIGLPSSKCEN
jgi:hypothetical protein